MISISGIPSECPLSSYNGTVDLQIKLNNQSSLIIDNLSIFSGEGKYHYAVKFIAIFSTIRSKFPYFELYIMSMELS